MAVFIKGVKIQTPIDQNTYHQLVSEPHVALTRINEEMCSYSRYRRQRHDSDDIYGPNFSDDEGYYRFRNKQHNYQHFEDESYYHSENKRNNHQDGYLTYNVNDSYRDDFAGSTNHYSGGFTRPVRLQKLTPPYHRYTPYQYREKQHPPPYYKGRQRSHLTFAKPKRPHQKKRQPRYETVPAPPFDEVSKSKSPVQSTKTNSSEDAITKESSCSDCLYSQDKPVRKVTSSPSDHADETLVKGGSSGHPTKETAKSVEVPDVKTENNTTMDLETVCFEAPSVEDIVDFIDRNNVVQTTDNEKCTTIKEDIHIPVCSDCLYSQDKPVRKVTSSPSDHADETLVKGGSSGHPTKETAKSVEVPDVKTENNATMDLETVCFEAPAVEDIVDFIDCNKVVQTTDNETCTTINEEMQPTAASSPVYDFMNVSSDPVTEKLPQKLPVPDFVMDVKASFLPKTPPNDSQKKDNKEQTIESTTLKNKCHTTKMVDVTEKTPRVNGNNNNKEKLEPERLPIPDFVINPKASFIPKTTPNESKKKESEEQTNETTTVKNKCDAIKMVNVAEKAPKLNSYNNKEKTCVQKSTSAPQKVEKRRITREYSSVKPKIPKLDVSSNKSSSSSRSKEASNAITTVKKNASTNSKPQVSTTTTSKMDEGHSKISNKNSVDKNVKKDGIQTKKVEPVKSSVKSKIRIIENIRLNNGNVSKSSATKQDQTTHKGKRITRPKEETVKTSKHLTHQHNESSNKKNEPLAKDTSKNKQKPNYPRKDGDYSCASKKVPPLRNGNTDISVKLDKKQCQTNETAKKQKDPITIQEPPAVSEKRDNTLMAERPAATPAKKQDLLLITTEERKAINSIENNKQEVEKTTQYRRKSVDVGVLIHRNELSAMMRKRRAKSVGPVTDAGDFFTGFRLTRSKSQELGATLITDVVDFSREHKKLNIHNTKPVLSRRESDCVHNRNSVTDKKKSSNENSKPFKLINVSGSFIKDPRLNRNANPQFLTKEKFMESMGQSGSLTGLKDYRFNFEKSQTHKYDKVEYVNTKPTIMLTKSPLHDHLPFSIESNSRTLISGDDEKPRREAFKSTNVSPMPITNDGKGNSEVTNVYLNPASPPHPRSNCSEPQPPKTKKILTNVFAKSEGPEFSKKEPLFQTFPSITSNANKNKVEKSYKPAGTTTVTINNPIERRKRGRPRKSNVSNITQNIRSSNIQNIRNTTSYPVQKLKFNKLKPNAVARPIKKSNHVNPVSAPSRHIEPHHVARSGDVPFTTSAILKDCLLHENIDKYFPSNSVKSSSMVLNVGDVSILMTEKGCKKVSHGSVETLADEQWQKVEEFLLPKSSKAKKSVFKGATEDIDRDMSLHEVFEPTNIMPVKQRALVSIVPKPIVVAQNGLGSDNISVTSPILPKPTVVAQYGFSSNNIFVSVTPIPQETAIVPENGIDHENIAEKRNIPVHIPSKSARAAENCFGRENINEKQTVTVPIPSKSTRVAESNVDLGNKNENRTVPVHIASKPIAVVKNLIDLENINYKRTVPLCIPLNPAPAVVENVNEAQIIPIPTPLNPTRVPEIVVGRKNVNEKRTDPVRVPSRPTTVDESSYRPENINENRTAKNDLDTGNITVMPKTAVVTKNSFSMQPVGQNPKEPIVNTFQAVSQTGCNSSIEPAINFSVTLPIAPQQPPVKRLSHNVLAMGLVPFIYRYLIYKNERHTFKGVREKMNRAIVTTDSVIADWKFLTDAYICTFQHVGNEMISYLKGVEIKAFQLGVLLQKIENFFRNNGFGSVTQPMILFAMHDVFLLCKPISESGFLCKFYKDVQHYVTCLMKLKEKQSSSNAPVQEHVPTMINRQTLSINNHQINSVSLSNNTTATKNNVVHTSVPNYLQISDGPRISSSITHNGSQRPPSIGQNGGFFIHNNYPSTNNGNRFNVQNPQIGDITTNNATKLANSINNNLMANQSISQRNNSKKPLQPYSRMSKKNAINKPLSHNLGNYGHFQRSNSLSGQGQETQTSHQNVPLPPPYTQSTPSTPMGYNNPYHNQSVMYNTIYEQNSQLGTAHLQNVESHNLYGNISNYRNQPRQNVVNNYNSSFHIQRNVPTGTQVGCSVYPPQNTAPSSSYFDNPATLPQVHHSSISRIPSTQNITNTNYNHPENTFQFQQNDKRKNENKNLDNARNLHLPRIQPPVSQTLHSVYNSFSTQHVTQNVSAPSPPPPPPPPETNSIVHSVPQQSPQRPHYLLKDLLHSNQFSHTNMALDEQNVPDVSRRNDNNNKEVSVEQRHHQVTSLPITSGKNVSKIDVPSQEPLSSANTTDNFKIYIPPLPSTNAANEQTQPENPGSSEEVPVNVHATSSNYDTVDLVVSDNEDTVNICDSEEEVDVEPEYISLEKWIVMNQEVIDLEEYDDIFESKSFKQDIKNETINDSYEEGPVTVEEFPPEVSSPDSGICTPRGDELNICFCGVKAAFVCSCRSVIYCSRRCQEVDWDSHQKDCKSQ